ncbi:hypothetical protein FOCC_FOCC004384, partial [Frankliniella occidentalis]
MLDGVVRNVQDLMQIRVEQVQDIRRAAEDMGRVPLRKLAIEVRKPYLGVKDKEAGEEPTPTPAPKAKSKQKVRWWSRGSTVLVPPTTTPAPTPPPTTPKPWLVHDEFFPGGSLINDSLSAVHVPADVNDGTFALDPDEPEEDLDVYMNSTGADVLRVIKLTSRLDDVFLSNKERDRTTSWQFFAHHSGVMRQYPASKWNTLYHEDFFDARLRPWYLGAAMSPKDVVILLDNSGSIGMTEPSKLTKLVVHMILDTLGPDDFVSVLLFNNTVSSLIPDLDLTLIPATSAYVRELQHALEDAVMLVTDVVPEHEEELFRVHNRPELDNPGQTHARVFTFYLPVMSRPLVLAGMHPVHWTHMYADVTVPGLTDVLWSGMEHVEQLHRVTPFCFKHAELHPLAKKHYLNRLPIPDRALGQQEEFVITVSVPARNLTSEGIENGDILGVAG